MKARLPLLLGMAALLLIAVVASRGSSAVHPGDHSLLPVHDNVTGTTSPAVEHDLNPVASTVAAIGFAGVLLVVSALFLFGLAVIIAGMVNTRTRRSRLSSSIASAEPAEGAGDPGVGAALLRGAVAEARRELAARRSGPPSDAVIAAWSRLEQAAAESGFAREPHQTATEFTTGVLAEHLGAQPAVARLRELYQRARFSRAGSVTEADADAARDALAAILDAFDGRQVSA